MSSVILLGSAALIGICMYVFKTNPHSKKVPMLLSSSKLRANSREILAEGSLPITGGFKTAYKTAIQIAGLQIQPSTLNQIIRFHSKPRQRISSHADTLLKHVAMMIALLATNGKTKTDVIIQQFLRIHPSFIIKPKNFKDSFQRTLRLFFIMINNHVVRGIPDNKIYDNLFVVESTFLNYLQLFVYNIQVNKPENQIMLPNREATQHRSKFFELLKLYANDPQSFN